MLLASLIANYNQAYSELQNQIELLQEEQRQIQAQLQRIGSVESKMESAAALLQEAIADMFEVCPNELPAYQRLVNDLFQPVAAQLPASEPQPEPAPEPQPEPTKPTIEVEAEEVDAIAETNGHSEQLQDALDVLEVLEKYGDDNGNGNGHSDTLDYDALMKLPISKLRKLADLKALDCGRHTKASMAFALEGGVTQQEVNAI